ncbi:alpha/beta hydrolase [Formosa maritima]|uniref:alpha/beta hydrolase n=1 Tax=Formosa maritima TaxID=2592046 RepID=UPI0013152DBA|nr:alpha/beta fold hydrolase [Formosa maritima]
MANIVQSQQIDSVTVFEKITINGFDSKIPFYHFINKRINTKNYIILLHGLGGSKKDWVYPSKPYLEWSENLKTIKDSLISLGYNLIIPDAKYHGERSYELDFRPAEKLPPMLSKNEADAKHFETLMTSTVKDIRIIIDYLQFRFENPDLKFGVIGYSMGGALAILLNATDNRISCIVVCVPPLNHPEKELKEFNWSKQLTKELSDVTPSNYSIFQKSPILLLMGKKDFFYTEKEVSSFFKNVPETKKELIYFDSGHVLPN